MKPKEEVKTRRNLRRVLLLAPLALLLGWGAWLRSWRPVEIGRMPWKVGIVAVAVNGEHWAAMDKSSNLLLDGRALSENPIPPANLSGMRRHAQLSWSKTGVLLIGNGGGIFALAPDKMKTPRLLTSENNAAFERISAFATLGDAVAACHYDSFVRRRTLSSGVLLPPFFAPERQIIARTNKAAPIYKTASNSTLNKSAPNKSALAPANVPPQGVQITSLAFAPDGAWLAGGTGVVQGGRPMLGQVTLWNAKTGEVAGTLQRHEDRVCGVAFSPNGNQLASLSEDGAVAVWKLKGKLNANRRGGEFLRAELLDNGEGSPQFKALAWSPDSARLGVLTSNALLLLDPATLKLQRSLRGPKDGVQSFAFSPDNAYIYTGNGDGSVWKWRLR